MPLVSVDEATKKAFDYVIIGGGTAGLVVGARLSEDAKTSVLVLEAGPANLNDNLLLRPGQFGMQFNKPAYDWAYTTVPQKHADGLVMTLRSGKGLGGSSGINLLCWTKPPASDIDDWERLGNPGWNWKNYEKYIAKSEGFVELDPEEQLKRELKLAEWNVGRQGPLGTAHLKTMTEVEMKAHQALLNLGLPEAPGPLSGNPNGAFLMPNTIDSKTSTRTYSTTAYYQPNATRENFSVLVGANVNKIVFAEGEGDLTATGVEFEYDGKTYVVNASKEVVVSAGSLKSPQILELSGIGRKDILEAIDVPVKVDLPGVGENLQEHTNVGISFELPDSITSDTLDIMRDPELAAKHADLHLKLSGLHTMGINVLSFNPLSRMSPRAPGIYDGYVPGGDRAIPAGLKEQYKIQMQRMKNDSPGYETIIVPGFRSAPRPPAKGKKYISFIGASNYPFSRGTVHAVSKNPRVNPAVDPHYFEENIDLESLLEMFKFLRRIPQTSPLKELLGVPNEYNPGVEVETDEQIKAWIKKCVGSTFHSAGTCAMLPRDQEGVVSPELKVYGTKNVRVVDLSIAPLHFASHSQATVYAIAEQGADLIKGIAVA
ncbi:alcohol oxidase [Mucidula mucida]|nr:alcohol oxidase [Mucidula mucida]